MSPFPPSPRRPTGPGWPTFAAELIQARATLTLADHIGMALRAHRRVLRLSQRDYALIRGLSKSTLSRLETHADQFALAQVVGALSGTGFALALVRLPAGGAGEAPVQVQATDWDRTEVLARVRGGARRFPGHREVRQVSHPPKWWWDRESTLACAVSPDWYAPTPRGPDTVRHLDSDETSEHGARNPVVVDKEVTDGSQREGPPSLSA